MMDANATKEALKDISKAIHRINSSEFEWNLDILIAAHETLLEEYAPFKVGQRVQLAKDVDCSDSPGWKSSEHFLKRGALATVDSVEFSKEKKFRFYIKFDHETWLSDEGPKPVSQKHVYCFGVTSLEPAPQTAKPSRGEAEGSPSPSSPPLVLVEAALLHPTPQGAGRLAGALFDFCGYLTSHPEVIPVGAAAWATPMVDRLTAWAKKRGLSLDGADVLGWYKEPSEGEAPSASEGPSPNSSPSLPAPGYPWRSGYPTDGYPRGYFLEIDEAGNCIGQVGRETATLAPAGALPIPGEALRRVYKWHAAEVKRNIDGGLPIYLAVMVEQAIGPDAEGIALASLTPAAPPEEAGTPTQRALVQEMFDEIQARQRIEILQAAIRGMLRGKGYPEQAVEVMVNRAMTISYTEFQAMPGPVVEAQGNPGTDPSSNPVPGDQP